MTTDSSTLSTITPTLCVGVGSVGEGEDNRTSARPLGANNAEDASPCSPSSPASTTSSIVSTVRRGKRKATQCDDEEWCLICHSSPILDRTVLPGCLHSQFCFRCILRWCGIARRCPLCQTPIQEGYVIHSIRKDDDYLQYHLPPPALPPSTLGRDTQDQTRRRPSRPNPPPRDTDADVALAFRKHIYMYSLYALHVGSNRFTHYTPSPSPATIRSNLAHFTRLISVFVRRELQVWPELDAEWLTAYIVQLLQVLDVSAEETVKLVGEFLGRDKARHLLHELEAWLRSGKKELRFYDSSRWLQYPRSKPKSRRRMLVERLEREKRALLATRSIDSES